MTERKKKKKRKKEIGIHSLLHFTVILFPLWDPREWHLFTGFKGATENIRFSPFKRSGHTPPAATGQVLVHSPVEQMFKAHE